MNTPVNLGNDAVHVIQKVVQDDQQAARPVELIPDKNNNLDITK